MTFFWHIIILIGTWLPGALTYTLIFGKGKILHFGPVGISLAAAYATFLASATTGNYLVALIIGFLVAGVVSLLFSWLSLRLDADGLGIMSIAVHLAVIAVILNWSSLTRGALGIPGLPRAPFPRSTEGFALAMVIISVLWILAMFGIDRSAFARKLEALAEFPSSAAALGINRGQVHCIAFLIGAVGAVFASVPYAHYVSLLHPNDYQFAGLIFYVTIVVAGKPGSILGCSLATTLLVTLKEILRFLPLPTAYVGPLRLLIFGVILFAAVWGRRESLFPQQRTV